MVKYPSSNAVDAGSKPHQGTKIPHAAGQLRPCATTTELARLNKRAHAPQLQSPHAVEPMHHSYRMKNPCATTREKPAHYNEEPT